MDIRDQEQWPVGAGAEGLGEHVVGLARGRPRGVVALVPVAEPQVEDGARERQDDRDRDHGHDHRAARDEGCPACPECPLVGDAVSTGCQEPALLAAEHAYAHEAEHRRQQGDGGRHGEHDGDD